MIEKNIFQTWKSKTRIPANFGYWSSTIKELNPVFSYILWDDADNRAFISENYPWFLTTYDAYPKEIYRADAVRYFWLYHHGGIYIDMDSECVKPLEPLLAEKAGVLLGRMGFDPTFGHSIPNAVMASASREHFWLYVFHQLMERVRINARPEDNTGPVFLKMAVDAYLDDRQATAVKAAVSAIQPLLPAHLQPRSDRSHIEIAEPHFFYPVNWADPIHQKFFRQPMINKSQIPKRSEVMELFPDSYIASYWAHSWESPEFFPIRAWKWLCAKARGALRRLRRVF